MIQLSQAKLTPVDLYGNCVLPREELPGVGGKSYVCGWFRADGNRLRSARTRKKVRTVESGRFSLVLACLLVSPVMVGAGIGFAECA
jgi:hypothetical protein